MINIIQIKDLDAPELQIYYNLNEAQLFHYFEPKPGIFIAESPKVIERALDAGCVPMSFLMEKKHVETQAKEILARCDKLQSRDLTQESLVYREDEHVIPVYVAEVEMLAKITGYQLTRGMLCAMYRPALSSVEQLCKNARRVAILENVVNPTNVGAIFRSAAALGMDAVLLSAFARVKKNEKALDLGTGTGILPILLEAKYPGLHYTGLEIQEESADMARRSVSYNGLEEQIDIVTGDIKEAASIFGAASFGVITTNPPYMIGDHGLKNQNEALYIARHEALCTLDDILRESAKILKVKGRFYMVHRPFRLPEIMTKMCAYGIEPKRMRLVYPYIDKEPNMVLIEGMKGGNPRMQVEPPLVVYQKDGSYTEELLALYGMSPS